VVDVLLTVLTEFPEDTRSVFVVTRLRPYFRGEGELNLLCGGCRFPLAEGIDASQIPDSVLRCPSCGDYNHARGA